MFRGCGKEYNGIFNSQTDPQGRGLSGAFFMDGSKLANGSVEEVISPDFKNLL
jgi:hypothetical protein